MAGRLAARSIADSPRADRRLDGRDRARRRGLRGPQGDDRELRGEIEVWAQDALVDKVYLGNLPNVPLQDLRQKLKTMYEGQKGGLVAIENGSARRRARPPPRDAHARALALRPVPGRSRDGRRTEKENGVILSKQLARHLEIKVDDKVHVANAIGAVEDLKVVAISDAYGLLPAPRRAPVRRRQRQDDRARVLPRGGDGEVVLRRSASGQRPGDRARRRARFVP